MVEKGKYKNPVIKEKKFMDTLVGISGSVKGKIIEVSAGTEYNLTPYVAITYNEERDER